MNLSHKQNITFERTITVTQKDSVSKAVTPFDLTEWTPTGGLYLDGVSVAPFTLTVAEPLTGVISWSLSTTALAGLDTTATYKFDIILIGTPTYPLIPESTFKVTKGETPAV